MGVKIARQKGNQPLAGSTEGLGLNIKACLFKHALLLGDEECDESDPVVESDPIRREVGGTGARWKSKGCCGDTWDEALDEFHGL
jgi:hypothetical protein